MLYYIIPLIDPIHRSVFRKYNSILALLKKTVRSLLHQKTRTTVVVVGSRRPRWFSNYQKLFPNRFFFIQLQAEIFRWMAQIDDGSKKFKNMYHDLDIMSSNEIINADVPQRYHRYFHMRGEFHNKDKGLKYFIGILFVKWYHSWQISLESQKNKKNLPSSQDFVGLIDGDDFIHQEVVNYLHHLPPNIDFTYVDQGYILKTEFGTNFSRDRIQGNQVQALYAVETFSQICGSNRFFRLSSLAQCLDHRLQASITESAKKTLLFGKVANGLLIQDILANIDKKPNAWNILPTFLGIHRVEDERNGMPLHPIQDFFTKKPIPFRAAIKHLHSFNHSQSNGDDLKACIDRYQEKNKIAYQIKRWMPKILKEFY
jgi:hypothetical protein